MFVSRFFPAVILFIILFFGCSDNDANNMFSLKDWLADKEKWELFILASNNEDCDKMIKIAQEMYTHEFKRNTYTYLAECLLDIDIEKSKKYLLKAVANGLHPDRIDPLVYASVYEDIKDKLFAAHHSYWASIDTTHFMELERRAKKDQEIRRKAMANPSDTATIHPIMRKIDKDNQQFLLDHCQKNGFPMWVTPDYFNHFRVIDPSMLVAHAEDSLKLIFLDYALKSVEKGAISWYVPTSISDYLFISGISQKEVYPLWLTYFDKNGNLDLEKSYLQLYSIKTLFDGPKSDGRHIKIHPSKYNRADQELINDQLEKIKRALTQEFLFAPEYLSVSDIPYDREPDYRDIKPYGFTLSFPKQH